MLKGQLITSDLVMAVFILIVMIPLIVLSFESSIDAAAENAKENDMNTAAVKISDLLVRTGGYPSNWENDINSTIVMGLASQDKTLDASKLYAFLNADYGKTKEIMNIRGYDYYFTLVNNGSAKGLLVDGEKAAFIRRIVSFNGAETLEFTLWK